MNRNEVLSDIYQLLAKNNIRYVCIGIPYYENTKAEGDIDLIVHPEDIIAAYSLVDNVLSKNKNILVISCLAPATAKLGAKKYLVTACGSVDPILQLDLAVSYHWRGLEYLTYSCVVKMTQHKNGVVQLIDGISPLIGGFKDIIYGQQVKEKRFERGYSTRKLSELLAEFGIPNFFVKKILATHQSKSCVSYFYILLWISKFRISGLLGFFTYIFSIIKIYGPFMEKDVTIAFYGPDGAGKSSIINEIITSPLIVEFFDDVIVRHTRPHYLPPISWYLAPFLRSKDRLTALPARSVVELGKLKSTIFVSYYCLDYLLGRLASMQRYFRRTRRLVVFDRYAFEFGYQQTFRQLPKPMIRLINILYKKPSLSIFVYANPDVIRERKDELTDAEIRYQVDEYKVIDLKYKIRSYFLDTTDLTIKDGADLLLVELLRIM